jgi:hypothetical protein
LQSLNRRLLNQLRLQSPLKNQLLPNKIACYEANGDN